MMDDTIAVTLRMDSGFHHAPINDIPRRPRRFD